MAKNNTKDDIIGIHEDDDKDRKVHLLPSADSQNELLIRTGKQVIEACRLDIGIELWLDELNSMLEDVAKWSSERKDRISSCYFSSRGHRIELFFAPSSDSFDFEFAEELTDLNLRLAKCFNVGAVEIHQVPKEELDRFINPGTARLVYGQEFRPHQTVEA